MSGRAKRMRDIREAAKHPDWEPQFHDAELRLAYEETRGVLDRRRWAEMWGNEPDPLNVRPSPQGTR